MKTIIMAMNTFYVDNLSVDVLRGMKEIALKCKSNGGVAPLGFQFVEQEYVIEESEATIIRLIFDMVDNHKSYNQILDELKARGHKTRKGSYFGKNSLYDILRNERYKGTYTFNKAKKRRSNGSRAGHGGTKPEEEIIRIPNGIPAIVAEDQWNRVNQLMDNRKLRAGGEARAKELYLLSGIIRCGECGHAMSGNSRHPAPNKPKVISYRCNHHDHNRACPTSQEMNRDMIEDFVIRQLQAHLFNEDIIPILTKQLSEYLAQQGDEAKQASVAYSDQLEELRRQKSNIVNAIATTGLEGALADKLEEIESGISDLEKRVQAAKKIMPKREITEDMVRGYLSSFAIHIKQRNLPKIKEFIKAFVEKVEVYNDRVKVTFKVAFFFEETGTQRSTISFEEERDRQLLKWDFEANRAIK